MRRTWEIGNHTFPIVWLLFSRPMVSFIIWEMHGFSHQFPIVRENATKTIVWGKTWEIGNHTFPIVWVLFSHPIPILWYTSSYGKCIGFPTNFPQYGKMQQNPLYGEDLGNWYSYFSHSMGAFLPLDSYPMVLFITWETYGFSNQFPIARENSAKTIKWEKPGKYFFHSMDALFHQIPILWYTSAYDKCMGVPINFPQHGKMQQNPGEGLGNWYSCFSHNIGAFLQPESHPQIYFITWEMLRFPHLFPIALENAAKSIELREPVKMVPILFP